MYQRIADQHVDSHLQIRHGNLHRAFLQLAAQPRCVRQCAARQNLSDCLPTIHHLRWTATYAGMQQQSIDHFVKPLRMILHQMQAILD